MSSINGFLLRNPDNCTCDHHIIQSEDTEASGVSPDSDEFVVELMTQCELRLQLLLEELQGKDLATTLKEMEDEEVSPLISTHPASLWF